MKPLQSLNAIKSDWPHFRGPLGNGVASKLQKC